MTDFCLDTSSWIYLAETFHIGKSSLKQLWDELDRLAQARRIMSPDEVMVELAENKDAIYHWVFDRKRFIIRPHDRDVQMEFRDIVNKFPRLTKKGKPLAKHEGDAWVLALAKVRGANVVSEETDELKKQQEKLPGVCRLKGVQHFTTTQFLGLAVP